VMNWNDSILYAGIGYCINQDSDKFEKWNRES